MSARPVMQTAAATLRRDEAEPVAAFDPACADLAAAQAECTALRCRNECLERRLAHLEAAFAEAEDARLRAFQAQKIEAIGQLTGGIAHDFNNLLTVMSGSLHLLSAAVAGSERCEQLVRRMEGAVGRGAEVTRRLLAFARRQILRPQVINLHAHAGTLATMLASGLGPHIALELSLAEDLWAVEADLAALELSLLNLAENARDAMPAGGRFVLAAGNLPVGPAAAQSAGIEAGDYVDIACTDSGTGMAPEVLARAFEPFFTTKAVGQGSGLGLPQVHGFAAQSGGAARLESCPGAGTTVSLLLPRAAVACREDAAPGIRPA